MITDKIYNELINLKYERKYSLDNSSYTTEVINKDARDLFRVALTDALSGKFNEYEAKIAALEAKVYAYEAILQNSNFAMALTKPVKDKNEEEG